MKKLILKVFDVLKTQGFKYLIQRVFVRIKIKIHLRKLFDSMTENERQQQKNTVFTNNIKFSILVPLYNTPINLLEELIDSLKKQTYSNWELCFADASDENHLYVAETVKKYSDNDTRIKYKKIENIGIAENTNKCAEMATGEYIGLLDHDDLLHESALYWEADEIEKTNADFLYSDEVIFERNTKNVVWTNFKPDFSPDALRSYNYITHFSVFTKELFDKVGRFKTGFDGAQDYDLILRLTEKAKCIAHIPRALYFWRSTPMSTASDISAKPYAILAGQRAVAAHLERQGFEAKVEEGLKPTHVRVKYAIKDNPLISIVIANKDHKDDLEKLLKSIFTKSTYGNYQIVIVENNSTTEEIFEYYSELQEKHNNVKVVTYKDVFNYSAINNLGVRNSDGEYILLLNNDMEVITDNWLEEMLMLCQRKDVGVVGAKLYFPDDLVQHAGVVLGIGDVAGHSHKGMQRTSAGYVDRLILCQNYSAVTGACLMTPKKTWDEVGGLEEKLTVSLNDVDYCMKIRKNGYLVVFTPFAELYHFESKSRGYENSPGKRERFKKEIDFLKSRWQKELDKGDPYYNPNLSLSNEKFEVK